ncbi:hypothetical protein [Zoogloea ramigera]|uniref:hypothetical protein n=1 Tax=Zoogloea ramigera TaxID=350 RepID=UPI003FA2E216
MEKLGAAQFAASATVDRLRTFAALPGPAPLSAPALAAAGPANPYGAALPWPARAWPAGTTPTRAAGGPACEPTTGTTSSSEPVPSRARRSRARARGRRRVTMARVITVGN